MSEQTTFEPKILAFLCWKWGYGASDMAGTIRAQYPASIRPIRVICTARISSDLIMRAFTKGADGVYIVGWHIGECDFVNGNLHARNMVAYLRDIMETVGLEPDRLRMTYCSAAEGARFKNIAIDMDRTIRKLGPNPLRPIQKELAEKAAKLAAKRAAAKKAKLKKSTKK